MVAAFSYTPNEVAEMLRVSPSKVIVWIRSGELDGFNVGHGTKKPRFRVTKKALEDFQQRRSGKVKPPAARPRRKKKVKKEDYIEFF